MMSYKTIAIFFAGVGVGAIGARFLLKSKYEKILDMEIDKVNKKLADTLEELLDLDEVGNKNTNDKPEVPDTENKKLFKHEIAKQAYDSYFSGSSKERAMKEAPVEPVDVPYVISGNEFITDQAHEKASLTYYINADILCEDDEPLDVPKEEILGDDFIGHFHDGEDGVVYVRNEKMGVDYEVILDESSEDFVREQLGFSDR